MTPGHLKIDKFLKTENKVIYLKITEAATGGYFVKKGILKNFANFTGKHLHWNFFLKKRQAVWAAALLKRDSDTGIFL